MSYLGKAARLFGAMILAGAGIASAQCDKTEPPPSVGSTLRVYRADADVVLSWQAVTGAEFYRVYRDVDFTSVFIPRLEGEPAATSWTDFNAVGNGNPLHKYKITAVNCAGESGRTKILETFFRSWEVTPEQGEFDIRAGKQYVIRVESANDNGYPGWCNDLISYPQPGMEMQTCSGPPDPSKRGCSEMPLFLSIDGFDSVEYTHAEPGITDLGAAAGTDSTAYMWNSDCYPPPDCPVGDNAGCANITVYETE